MVHCTANARSLALLVLAVLLLAATPSVQGQLGNRTVVYITDWAQYRSGSVGGTQCQWYPANMPANLATHVIFSFAYISGTDYTLQTSEYNDVMLYAQTQALKQVNPKLKTLLALGGWSFSDPGPTQPIWGNMVASPANRAQFIASVLAYTQQYGFDGVDFDWEYPVTADRGGRASDKPGLVAVVRELRAAANAAGRSGFIITMAVSSCPYGCDGLNAPALTPYLDWYNLMSYDYWGAWAAFTGPSAGWVDPLKVSESDISRSLNTYLKTYKVPPSKIVLGLALYGRGWYLQSANPGQGYGAKALAFQGPSGQCTQEPGFLAWYEVKQYIANGATVTINALTKDAYLQSGTTWISFDLPQTLYMKIQAAAQQKLGGLMVWDASLDDAQNTLMNVIANRADPGPFQSWRQYSLQIVFNSTKPAPASITNAQRDQLVRWNAALAGVGLGSVATTTTSNSIILTWTSTKTAAAMRTLANKRFWTGPAGCPSPAILAAARQVQARVPGRKVAGFNFLGPADNLSLSYSVADVSKKCKHGGKVTAAAVAASALATQQLAAAATQAAAVTAPKDRPIKAAPGTTAAEWESQLRGVRGPKPTRPAAGST